MCTGNRVDSTAVVTGDVSRPMLGAGVARCHEGSRYVTRAKGDGCKTMVRDW